MAALYARRRERSSGVFPRPALPVSITGMRARRSGFHQRGKFVRELRCRPIPHFLDIADRDIVLGNIPGRALGAFLFAGDVGRMCCLKYFVDRFALSGNPLPHQHLGYAAIEMLFHYGFELRAGHHTLAISAEPTGQNRASAAMAARIIVFKVRVAQAVNSMAYRVQAIVADAALVYVPLLTAPIISSARHDTK